MGERRLAEAARTGRDAEGVLPDAGSSGGVRALRGRGQIGGWVQWTVVGVFALVVAAAVYAPQWWWGVFDSPQVFDERYESGALLARTTVVRERAHRIPLALWGNERPEGYLWYWVVEFHGYHENTGTLAEHGFFHPFPAVSGDPQEDNPVKHGRMYQREGEWTSSYDNGVPASKGNYVGGTRDGAWMYWFRNGNVRWTGAYRRDAVDGEWRSYHNNGKLRAIRHTINDEPHGTEQGFDENGTLVTEIPYVYGKETGTRKTYHENGKLMQSWEVRDDLLQGPFRRYDDDGNLVEEGNYIDGKKDGLWVTYYPNGQRESEQMHFQDILHGHESRWYANGKLKSEGEYRNKLRDGHWTTWDEAGNKQTEGDWVDDSRHGEWKTWDSSGTASTVVYDKGKVVSRKAGE
ncbi:MAG: toxin-antitoxin system YwqK family antitoxin [Planctomycetia bacterium]|nr:toxin-antitoxin system YwqK family antitoxin [Planctomycetia bacterium]